VFLHTPKYNPNKNPNLIQILSDFDFVGNDRTFPYSPIIPRYKTLDNVDLDVVIVVAACMREYPSLSFLVGVTTWLEDDLGCSAEDGERKGIAGLAWCGLSKDYQPVSQRNNTRNTTDDSHTFLPLLTPGFASEPEN
jgi:hypothetical protein